VGYVPKVQYDPAQVIFGNERILPFVRFFKGAPQIEHFYTSSNNEQQLIKYYGYTYEGAEGGLFTSGSNVVTGLVPLVRLNKFNASNGDLVHKWTTNSSTVNSLVSQGWGNDGVAGYVWPTSSKTEGGVSLFKPNVGLNSYAASTRGYCTLSTTTGCQNTACPETADFYIDDVYAGSSNSQLVRTLSGNYCAASVSGLEPNIAVRVAKKVRLEYSGYVASGPGYFYSVPPTGGTLYIQPL
jgi:Repeat of unknown function (DUF5648)